MEGAFLFHSVLVQRYNVFYNLTPCQLLTARTDDLYTQLCIRPILIFKLPQDHIYRGLKIIIIIIQNLLSAIMP